MDKNTFLRTEEKFMMSREQYQHFMRAITEYMVIDEYKKHTITNIYYDTEHFDMIRRSIDKPKFKEKIRLRGYGTVQPNSKVFLEVKRKYHQLVYKRRVRMENQEAMRYLNSGIQPKKREQIFREIDYTVKRYQVRPVLLIAYDRISFFGKENKELRLTIDANLRSRTTELDLAKGPHGEAYFDKPTYLMEIKIDGALPMWLTRILNELRIYPCSFSKYGKIYAKYIRSGDGQRSLGLLPVSA